MHAVLPNFLKAEVAEDLYEHSTKVPLEISHGLGLAKEADWHWGAFSHLDFIRFFLGFEFRKFLNFLMTDKLTIKPKAYLQLNVFQPRSAGIPIHNDYCEEVGIVSLLQLSKGWQPGFGGELIFHRRENSRWFRTQVLAPEFNKLILFKVSKDSFHSVADMDGDFIRRVIAYDWLIENAKPISMPLLASN